MNQPASPRGKGETYVGIAVLAILAGITCGILLKQSHYDPAVFAPSLPSGSAPDLSAYLPGGMEARAPGESFGPDTLYVKIDGKAETYLSAGLVRLDCRRFALRDDPKSWMEAFIYDMGTPRGAFGVFTTQRRPEAQRLDLTGFAYKTQNALFLAHGPYYVEIVAAADTPRLNDAMLAFGRNFVAGTPAPQDKLQEIALFPAEGLVKDSISLMTANQTGFEALGEVFTARYSIGDGQAVAFLARQPSRDQAGELVKSYHRFLISNGWQDEECSLAIPGVRLVSMSGTFRLVFSRGQVLAGIHESESRTATEKLALLLDRRLSEDLR